MTEKQPSTDPQAEGDPRANGVSRGEAESASANVVSRGEAEALQPRITNTQKEKDPRKVAAGKKLGAISKMAKKQKSLDNANAANEAENLENDNNFNTTIFYAGLAAAAVVVGCLGVKYFTKQQPHPEPSEVPAVPAGPKFSSNLISLDD